MSVMRALAIGAAAVPLLLACGGRRRASAPDDPTVPVVQLTSPAQLARDLAGAITLSAAASDDVGVRSVEFQLDGAGRQWHRQPLPHDGRHDALCLGSARRADAGARCRGQPFGLVDRDGRVRRQANPAGRLPHNESWVTGLANATAFAQAPDGRLFVAQQGGALRVVKNGALLAAPFYAHVDAGGERGLIGVTLHPDFATTASLRLLHDVEGGTHNRISRFTGRRSTPTAASAARWSWSTCRRCRSATNHNGGALHFGGDGKLYVGVGDNADGDKAQDLADLFGKMLRLNDDGRIPTDNPFSPAARPGARGLGLRPAQPLHLRVQPGTGRMHINDVGQNTWEEIDLGCGRRELRLAGQRRTDPAPGETAPLFAYAHDSTPAADRGGFFTGFAIAGGAFYPRAGRFPRPTGAATSSPTSAPASSAARCGERQRGLCVRRGQRRTGRLLAGTDGALYVLRQGAIERFRVP